MPSTTRAIPRSRKAVCQACRAAASAANTASAAPLAVRTCTSQAAAVGLAATILWALDGRTAGVSTIAGGIFPIRVGDEIWRFMFLVGLPLGAWLGVAVGPSILPEIPRALPAVTLAPAGLVVAGLLVGI